MTLRTYYCPECDGDVWLTINDSRDGDPQCEREVLCTTCEGVGFIDADADLRTALRPYTPSRRRWAGERRPIEVDSLEAMRQLRPLAVRFLQSGRPMAQLDYTFYGSTRLRAMRPVSGLAKADMLANSTRLATAVDRLRDEALSLLGGAL